MSDLLTRSESQSGNANWSNFNRILVLIVSCTTFLTACRSFPKTPRIKFGFQAPATWTVTGGRTNAVVEEWWAKLGSSNLAQTVIEALNRNHDLQLAAARLAEAEAQAQIAGADLLPTLGLGFDASRSQRNFIGFPIPGSERKVLTTRSTSYGVALNTSWELDLWGRIRSGKKAATADTLAAASDLRAARESIAAQTIKAWLAVTESAQQLRLAEQTVQSYRITTDQIRNRYRLGLRPPLDLRLAETTLSSTRAAVTERRRQLDRATRQLEIILGRYPSGKARTDTAFPALAETIPSGLPSELLARRPDVIAAEQRLAAADARLRQSKASLLPRISLTASGGTGTEDLADLLSSDFGVWTLAGNLAQPILQGGRLRAGVRIADSRTQQALTLYQKTALTAFAEVETALAAEEYLRIRTAELSRAADQAEAALRLATERYASGVEPFLTVLEAQRRTFDARSQFITAQRARIDNRVDLHAALGGGFEHNETSIQTDAEMDSGTELSL